MSLDRIINLIIYLLAFLVSLYALYGIDFSRLMRKGKTMEIQVVYILLAMALSYLVGNFIIVLIGR